MTKHYATINHFYIYLGLSDGLMNIEISYYYHFHLYSIIIVNLESFQFASVSTNLILA